jgi:hypothetical protein
MFIGNPQQYNQLVSWISHSYDHKEKFTYKHICFIAGISGVGKTYGIEKALENTSSNLYKIDQNTYTNSKEFKDFLIKLTTSHIVSQFENTLHEDKIIWIDDFDSFLALDRTFLHTLENILENESIPAIKCIISSIHVDVKHYGKFYSNGLVLQLYPVQEADIILLLRKTFLKIPVKTISTIAECADGNISAALHMAGMENSIDKKFKNGSIFNKDNCRELINLFDEKCEVSTSRYLFDLDPWLHPLRFHENVLYEFKQRKGLQIQKEHSYKNMMKLFCEWDQLMAANKGGDTILATEMISYVPFYLKEFPKKKIANSSIAEFTRMFNYLSLKKKNAVALYNNDFPWNMIGNYYKHIIDEKNKKKSSKTKNFSI